MIRVFWGVSLLLSSFDPVKTQKDFMFISFMFIFLILGPGIATHCLHFNPFLYGRLTVFLLSNSYPREKKNVFTLHCSPHFCSICSFLPPPHDVSPRINKQTSFFADCPHTLCCVYTAK